MSRQKGQLVGYARVSTAGQNLARQLEALADADRVFEENASARDSKLPVLAELLAYVRERDTVLTKSPDRLARSTRDLLDQLSELKTKGEAVRFADSPALDTGTAQGTFMLTVVGAVAELERELIAERRASPWRRRRAGTTAGRSSAPSRCAKPVSGSLTACRRLGWPGRSACPARRPTTPWRAGVGAQT